MQKLYCYVDESGQDTKGRFFLVSVVISDKTSKDEIENILLDIEHSSGKGLLKWRAAPFVKRIAYLEAVLRTRALKYSIFYAVYHTSKEYLPLTTYTIAQAIGIKTHDSYLVTIVIDGLNKKERELVTRGLRTLKIHYKKVRGARDEASPLVRLADACAGLLRDFEEGAPYAQEFVQRLLSAEIVKKLE